MKSDISPNFQAIKLTSGAPFEFADKFTALLACHMLAGVCWPDVAFGQITKLHCEVSQDDWLLDDLLVVFSGRNEPGRLALSLKSNCQFTKRAAPNDLVDAAWRQYLSLNAGGFVRVQDYWGIITAPHSPRIRDAIHGLIADARNQPLGTLAARVAEQREPSSIKRDLFNSFACPAEIQNLTGQNPSSGDTTGLLSRFVFQESDFEVSPSNSEAVAVALCQQCLSDAARAQAAELWKSILSFTHSVRIKGGFIDLPKLVAEVRARFPLKAHPSFAEPWQRLRSYSISAVNSVRMDLAGQPPMAREVLIRTLNEASSGCPITLLAGRSGTGKSVLARMHCEAARKEGASFLWFRGRDLELPGALSIEERFKLGCGLADLLRIAPGTPQILVLDGLEACFSDDGFHRAASLISAAFETTPAPWRVLITCQPEDWDRVRSGLRKAGVQFPQEPDKIVVGNFTVAEGRQQLKAFPALGRLFFQPQVSEFILRPKIFDLLARHLTEEEAKKDRPFATEADLVHWFWREVVCKDGPVSARDQFLRRFGLHQGDHLESATATDMLNLTNVDRAVVSELVRDRILAEDPDAGLLRFDHDLLADWSRERELQRHQAELAQFLATRLTKPLWHRALRLHGLHLLESSSPGDAWLKAFKAFEPGLAVNDLGRNLLLQSVIFASDVSTCLDRLWPELVKDDGALLRALLVQFQMWATTADSDLVSHYEQTRPDLVVQAAALHRVPWLADWPGLFRALGLRKADALSLAPQEISILCEAWLKSANPKWRSAQNAAELAVDAARIAKDSRRSLRSRGGKDAEISVYKALLSASEVMPNEVSCLVLELSGRRLPPGVDESALREDDAYGIFNIPLGKRRPWPEGPRHNVGITFREVFLHKDNVISLMRVVPQVAAEAMLALLLDIPRERNYDRDSGNFLDTTPGFIDDHTLDMQFPIWFRGPFIYFLRLQPKIALETIIRLVNFATDRCLEAADGIWAPVSVDVELPSGETQWVGNQRSYFWSLEDRGTSGSVSCALMALERWLYEQLDAGQSIEPVVERILSSTRSLAFAGLLLRVGRKQPGLLRGCLLPLLGVPEFHWMEATSRPSEFDFYVGILESRQESQARKEWYEQSHRKTDLHTFARQLFLSETEWRPIFEDMRQQWLRRVESATAEKPAALFLEAFAAAFELANYRKRTEPSGETVIEYVPPVRLGTRDPEEVKKLQIQGTIASVLWSCQGMLTGEEPPTASPDEIWRRFESLAEVETPEESRGFQEVQDALCAIAAVLVESHRDYLRSNPEKEEACLKTLLKPSPSRFALFEHPGIELPNAEANAFCARALPTLWNESPKSRNLRGAIASLVVCGSYSTLRTIMVSASRYRDSLKENFHQLEWLVQGWAVARNRERRQQYCQEKGFDLNEWSRQQMALFIKGKVQCPGETLPQAAQPDLTRPVPGHHGHTDRADTGIEIQCLLEAYSWATDLSKARSPAERRHFIEIHKQILESAMTAFRVNVPDDEADFDGPYEDEKVLIKTVASLLLQMGVDENASQLWRPVMELAPKSRFWGSWFITDLFTGALEKRERFPILKRVWQEMLEFAFQSPSWTAEPNWNRRRDMAELWRDLLKIESSFWSEDDPETVALLHFVGPYLERWAEHRLQDDDDAVALIHLLGSKAAKSIRCQGLLWLRKRIPVDSKWEWEEETVQNSLANLLVLLANQHGAELKQSEEARSAFLSFATRLAAQQHNVAVELLQRISRQNL